jgi:hypothetical protein
MRTPVPKWRERKRKRWGMGSLGKRRAIMGKEHAVDALAIERRRGGRRGEEEKRRRGEAYLPY